MLSGHRRVMPERRRRKVGKDTQVFAPGVPYRFKMAVRVGLSSLELGAPGMLVVFD
jgi:hypothetical protein